MKHKLLNCIMCYNRYYYLKNLLDSFNEFFNIGDILLIDDGSDEELLLEYFKHLEAEGVVILHQPHEEHNQWLFGGLYSAMNKGIEFAIEHGYDFINFIQDDMQFVWNDPDFMNRVIKIFDQFPETSQISYHFFKKIMRTRVEKRITRYEDVSCYHFRPFTISDLGIISTDFIRSTGFRVTGSEKERNDALYCKGYRRFNLSTPNLAWIPWPTTFRKKNVSSEMLQPLNRYYLKPLKEKQIRSLVTRPFEILPCHEDYIFPWGWKCLTPYWFTTPNTKEYLNWILRSWVDGAYLMPHYV